MYNKDVIWKQVTFLLGGNMKEKKSVTLVCVDCLSRNYVTHKKGNSSERLELKKFCPKCGKHTIHKETK